MLKKAPIGQTTRQQKRHNLAEIRVLHNCVVDERLLGMLKARLFRTVELDISSTNDGYYIGHHKKFYRDRDLLFPPFNVSIEEAMRVIAVHKIFTKLDCKDEEAIPKVTELAQILGPGSCMLHAYAKEFDYQTKKRQSHWVNENINLKKIIKLRDNTKYPFLQVSCRGFTYNEIATLKSSRVSTLREICAEAVKNGINVINLNLPNKQIPPDWVLRYFFDNDVLLEVYESKIGKRQLPCDVFTTIESKQKVVPDL